jgi:hypothetical protein
MFYWCHYGRQDDVDRQQIEFDRRLASTETRLDIAASIVRDMQKRLTAYFNQKSHRQQVAFHFPVGGTRLELVTSTMST